MMRTSVLNAGSDGSCKTISDTKERESERRTRHLSSDAANAPLLETSSVSPLRFFRMSCSFSKFVLGGGRCRLRATTNMSVGTSERPRDSPEDGRLRKCFLDLLRDADVRKQHELLDEAVRLA